VEVQGAGGAWVEREAGGEVGTDASSSMSEGPEGAGGDSTSMAEAWEGGSTSMVDATGGRLGREAGGLGSSWETFPAWAVVMVVPHLTGGGLDLTMGETSNGCQSNQRLRHRVACEERSSKQKGIGEGKEGKGGGSISFIKEKLPWTEKAAEEGGRGVMGQGGDGGTVGSGRGSEERWNRRGSGGQGPVRMKESYGAGQGC